MPLLGHNYPNITLNQITPHLINLDLKIVGGLKRRGYTKNDIDIIGEKKDIKILAQRLAEVNIRNPLHHCGEKHKHSHFKCTLNGIKLAFSGKG